MIPRHGATGRWSQNRTGSQSPSLIARKQQWSQFCLHVYCRSAIVVLQQCYSPTWETWSWSDLHFSFCPTSVFFQSDPDALTVFQILCAIDCILCNCHPKNVAVLLLGCDLSPWFLRLLPRPPCLFSNAQPGRSFCVCVGIWRTVENNLWSHKKKKNSLANKKNCACASAKTNQSRHYVRPRQAANWKTRPTRLLSMWTRGPFSTDGCAQWRARRRGPDLLQTAARSSPLCRPTSPIHLGRQAGAKGEKI